MPTLSNEQIITLLQPFLRGQPLAPAQVDKLSLYLDLLLKWNARTNLTAIRSPEDIVRRHFGESLFAGRHLIERVQPDARVLDFGSGAGFPGLPIQIAAPELRVTLAESQGKKAAFLREVVRVLELNTAVWGNRVETMPTASRFQAVTLRAVDRMEAAVSSAKSRLADRGWMLQLIAGESLRADPNTIAMPGAANTWLVFEHF
jgi:16S rRNA (guanine527-N7)-methyltransferase